MAERDAKRLRLAGLIGLKGISTSALAAVLKRLHEEPLEPLSARQIDKFISDTYIAVGHTIQLPLVKGGTWDWKVCRLDNLMAYFAKDSEAYRQILTAALQASSEGHLNAVVYLDEVTPGNVLRPDNARKFWAFYVGFREMPATALVREQFWLPLAVLRTHEAQKVVGGISNCFRLLLRSVLFAPCHAEGIGFAIDLGRPRLIRLKIRNILADESALKAVFGCKGAAGIRPCLLCRNIVSLNSNMTEGQHYLVDISCSDAGLFHPATDATILQLYDNLAERRPHVSKTAFEKLQKASGFSFCEHGLLSDADLRPHVPPSTYTMDWMHNFLCHGVASIEIGVFLQKCKDECGITHAHLQAFVQSDWKRPKFHNVHSIADVFSATRQKGATEGFRGSAAEILMVFPLLRHFTTKVVLPTHKIDVACGSFLKMCHVVDEFLKLKVGRSSNQQVLELLKQFLDLHKACYGTDWIKPKHHFSFHNILSLQDDRVWLDCFVHERKHQVVKGAGTAIKNTSAYESSVLGRVLLEQWRQLQGCKLSDTLLGRDVVDDKMSASFGEAARVARALQYGGLEVNVDDILFAEGSPSAFCVTACVFLEGSSRLVLLVQLLERISADHGHSTYRLKSEWYGLCLDGSLKLSLPYCWTWSTGDEVVILHPVE